MATKPNVQLFRNSNIISGRSAAIDTLKRQKEYVPDGGLILATYSSDNGVKTLLGIVRNSGGTEAQLTVIDVEGAAENVQDAITSAINKLNKADSAVDGQYVSSVSEDKGIITVTRKPLPSFDEKTDSGKAITAITQTNGEVSVKFGGVAAANVSVVDKDEKITATNVEDALLEIKNSLDAAMSGVRYMIDGKINALNSNPSFKSQHITVGVNQNNGIIKSVFVQEDNIASEAALTAEVNDRQSADTTLQTNIDNVNSGLTAHTADTTVHVTQADKDKWNTPTDLSNYYTKEEVDEKDTAINATIEAYGQVTSQALNDLGTRMDDYGKVTSQSLNDLSTKFGDYYTKTEVDSKDATLQTALDALEARIAELETKFLNMEK